MKIACFSIATVDFFPQQRCFFPGGNALNQAVRLSQWGQQCAFIGPVGTDDAGERIRQLLAAKQVDISCLHRLSGKTARNQIINDAEGERFGMEGEWEGGVYDEFRLSESDWRFLQLFHIWVTHSNHSDFLQIQEKKAGQFLSVDFLHLPDMEVLRKSLAAVDLAFVGGTLDMTDELSSLATTSKCIIVLTLGAQGSVAFKNSDRYDQAALPTDCKDTTGCGDAFQAGFLNAYLKTGDIPEALAAGAESGRITATHYGGSTWD